jgi:agmatinase
MEVFDPNAAATPGSGIFGLPFSEEESALVLLPVPWEATVSYGQGTSLGPAAMLAASCQLDLLDVEIDRPYAAGICMAPEPAEVLEWNGQACAIARPLIERGGAGNDPERQTFLREVTSLGERLNTYVCDAVRRRLARGKIIGIIGGDHSVSLGAVMAIAEQHAAFGILHFDAHADARAAYQGFLYSHASIMRNILDRMPEVTHLTQVGIRELCEEELDYLTQQGKRVDIFFNASLRRRQFAGTPWNTLVEEIVASLPSKVWISFDIDALDPWLCPHTGTPVPGGLEFDEADHVLRTLALSGRRILGFDLTEVAPAPSGADEWDANVGMRLLYRLCVWTLLSQGKAQPRGG